MSSLLDLLLKTNNNGLSGQIANQYGIEQNQAEAAMQALMPAFSEGLRRNASSPKGFGAFMQALAQGEHSQYSNNPTQAFSEQGIGEGNQILGHLFKSKDLSRKIVEQASAASNVPPNVLKQMLPALAPIILGALTKNMQGSQQANAPSQQYAAAGGANPLGRILEELMKGGLSGGGSGRGTQQRGNNPLGDILEQMMGRKGGFSGQPNRESGQSAKTDRLSEIFGEMLDGRTEKVRGEIRPDSSFERTVEPESYNNPYPQADKHVDNNPYADERETNRTTQNQRRPRSGGLEDLFGEMFKPSQKQNPKYDHDIESIFDEFLGPNNR